MGSTAGRRRLLAPWILALPMTVFMLAAPLEFLFTSVMYDDACYYLQIAGNIAAGRGSTFDGFTITNGYHPLWLGLLVALKLLVPAKLLALRLAAVLSVVFATVSWQVFGLLLRDLFGESRAAGFSFFLFPLLFFFAVYGMETWLSIALLLLLLRSYASGNNAQKSWVQGVLTALVILARMDTVFPAAALALVYGGIPRSGWFSVFLRRVLPAIVLVGGYMLFSQLYFGTALSVSSSIKSLPLFSAVGSPDPAFGERLHALLSNRVFAVFAGLLPLTAFLVWVGRQSVPAPRMQTALLAGGVMHLCAVLTRLAWGEMVWYFFPYAIGFLLSLPLLTQSEKSASRFAGIPAPVLLLLWALPFAYMLYGKFHLDAIDDEHAVLLESVVTIPAIVRADQRLATPHAGILGYLTGRSVFDMDGLVTDRAYCEAVRTGRIASYLRDHGIDWLFLPVSTSSLSAPIRIPYLDYSVTPGQVRYRVSSVRQPGLTWILFRYLPGGRST